MELGYFDNVSVHARALRNRCCVELTYHYAIALAPLYNNDLQLT